MLEITRRRLDELVKLRSDDLWGDAEADEYKMLCELERIELSSRDLATRLGVVAHAA